MNSEGTKLSSRFEDALAFAAHLHSGQLRKGGGIPFVSHLLAVTSIVLESGGSEDEAIGALLHDAAEDAGGSATLEEIRAKFGNGVADIVDACSDTMVTPKPDWRTRKDDHIAHLAHASASVRLIIAADKLHNVRSMLRDFRVDGDALWSRFNSPAPKADTLWYCRAVAEAPRRDGPDPLLDELDRSVAELEREAASQDLPSRTGPGGKKR
jgi:(p)ppGpp synthase/HD superfamily hydrolase